MFRFLGLTCFAISAAACTTVPDGPATPGQTDRRVEVIPESDPQVIATAARPLPTPPPAPRVETPPPVATEPPPSPVIEAPALSGFAALPNWKSHDPRPALSAFVKGCQTWTKADPNAPLNPNLPQYGRFKDWISTCQSASVLQSVEPSDMDARNFFESWFVPVNLSTPDAPDGLLTGYYEPEVEVRLQPDATFSEPILAKPATEAALKLPRAKVTAATSRIIAYGRPIDVFFLQIQGSGRLKYADGRILRAAYAANNGQAYRSIGGVLIARGELTKEQASKQSIADWMTRNGPQAARALMNENPRYISPLILAIILTEASSGSIQFCQPGPEIFADGQRGSWSRPKIRAARLKVRCAQIYFSAQALTLASARESKNTERAGPSFSRVSWPTHKPHVSPRRKPKGKGSAKPLPSREDFANMLRLPAAPSVRAKPTPLTLDVNQDKRVRRGRVDIDAKIDLHDMTQSMAQPALHYVH